VTVEDKLMRFPVFGSTAVVAVTEAEALDAAAAAVILTAAEFDAACSRFRDDSELSAVNAGAGARSPSDRSCWRPSRHRCVPRG